ncbi:hypothetical protein AVL62_05935 [Serinicoccus chungangensis]|uniref:Lsr2 family protein n=1 Tax=Serinicoccus chungangensis TaxID=767452 RepID=A0A0W8IH73_9MICO|nr:Lsr2 family protein [Serinicoccus chungangensis]KUG59224.1 hypothetical protein AVL62_05935 [Serinicoccus chungangensis]
MAQNVKVILVDDIDGTEAHQTVEFALDGVSYTIDLHDQHATELRETFMHWVDHARRTGGRRQTRRLYSGSTTSRDDLDQIRAWARENGYQVSDRGRIAKCIVDAYDAAHS